MLALVTGVAGFVGSTLSERLLVEGWNVRGVDCWVPNYDLSIKRSNVAELVADPRFEFVEVDLRTAPVDSLLADVDVVFHQAAQPGVRLSWSDGFHAYAAHNVTVTQRLLEAAKNRSALTRFVYASSSSIYGNVRSCPTHEDQLPRPHSPYGVTKLAAEHLCGSYAANWGVPAVSLRYFTVYGPRQRPDMAIHRLIEAALTQTPFSLFGDGSAVRDFTYVGDVVAANIAASQATIPAGTVVNIAGGASCTMAELIEATGEVVGQEVRVERRPPQPGDVERTGGSIDAAATLLGWKPEVSLQEGLAAQAEWHRHRRVNGTDIRTFPSSPARSRVPPQRSHQAPGHDPRFIAKS